MILFWLESKLPFMCTWKTTNQHVGLRTAMASTHDYWLTQVHFACCWHYHWFMKCKLKSNVSAHHLIASSCQYMPINIPKINHSNTPLSTFGDGLICINQAFISSISVSQYLMTFELSMHFSVALHCLRIAKHTITCPGSRVTCSWVAVNIYKEVKVNPTDGRT